jgi:hypothetical protein
VAGEDVLLPLLAVQRRDVVGELDEAVAAAEAGS